ncbi:endonuclease domain-containing protein [Sphingomonas nostoxanthinifaciens]|uniref:endonuclease domain-containing protein n=1 Tax=Sphingomonas nostoxanthinifaciens TaxID=2872652 RepID=UPI001CC1D8CF|nr:endonuclease domain-containing protein [Sphingomonas nostoxanthinifaciens]
MTPVARDLRRTATDVEAALWQRLRNRKVEGTKFVRQLPIGQHVADFASRSLKIVIELDGGQHATSATDAERTRLIEARGYTVIRFWNNDVAENMDGVLEEIRRTILLARG